MRRIAGNPGFTIWFRLLTKGNIMQVTIKQSTIKAVSYAMAKKDIRYYLNGMLLQHNGEETRLVATDGHRLNMAVIEHESGLVCDLIEVIIPDTLIGQIIKAKAPRHDKRKEITITIDGDKIAATMPDGTQSIAKAVDGKFPDYQRVIPDSFSREISQFSPEYMGQAYDSVRAYLECDCYPEFLHSGSSVGGIVADNFLALVMPWRAAEMESDTSKFKTALRLPEIVGTSDTAKEI